MTDAELELIVARLRRRLRLAGEIHRIIEGIAAAPPALASFTCPRCGAVSYHPADVEQGYCGRCHAWTGGDA